MNLYVTYGLGSNLKDCYSVVEAIDPETARKMVDAATGGAFAFTYEEHEFAGMAEKYNLQRVPLQAQVINHG